MVIGDDCDTYLVNNEYISILFKIRDLPIYFFSSIV